MLNYTYSTSNSLSGRLKLLTNKAKNFLVISKSGRGLLRELLIRGVWVKVKTGFHGVDRN